MLFAFLSATNKLIIILFYQKLYGLLSVILNSTSHFPKWNLVVQKFHFSL